MKKMSPEFIDIINGYAQKYYYNRRLGNMVAWTANDLGQEMVCLFLKEIEKGTLYQRVNRQILYARLIDAYRKLQTGTEGPDFRARRQLYQPEKGPQRTAELSHRIDTNLGNSSTVDSDESIGESGFLDALLLEKRETAERGVSPLEIIQENQEPQNPAEELRDVFESEGSLWTRHFHEEILVVVDRESHTRVHELIHEMGLRKHNKTSLAKFVLGWVSKNPRANPTHAWLAKELDTSRETVSRLLGQLLKEGRIDRERVEEKGATGRETGQWSYFIKEEGK